MRKQILTNLVILSAALALTGCSTMKDLKNGLADLQLEKKTLNDGQTVYVDYNVEPTAEWGCRKVDRTLSYNWAKFQFDAQFKFSNGMSYLMKEALTYANDNALKINYINLSVPNESTFNQSYGRVSIQQNLDPDAEAQIALKSLEKAKAVK